MILLQWIPTVVLKSSKHLKVCISISSVVIIMRAIIASTRVAQRFSAKSSLGGVRNLNVHEYVSTLRLLDEPSIVWKSIFIMT